MEAEYKFGVKQLTREQAIALHDSGEWENWTDEEIVRLQIFQDRLCVPFEVFTESLAQVLCRSVYTHEFANQEALILEYLNGSSVPSFEEIIQMIPEEKRLVIGF